MLDLLPTVGRRDCPHKSVVRLRVVAARHRRSDERRWVHPEPSGSKEHPRGGQGPLLQTRRSERIDVSDCTGRGRHGFMGQAFAVRFLMQTFAQFFIAGDTERAVFRFARPYLNSSV
jgi:hypothetical protein